MSLQHFRYNNAFLNFDKQVNKHSLLCFQNILNNTKAKQNTYWFKNLKTYYKRPEWELYDIRNDALELNNLAGKSSMTQIFKQLKQRLEEWQKITNDPWLCAPHAVFENKGLYKDNPQCLSLDNEIDSIFY